MHSRPFIRVVIDGTTASGRQMLRGVIRYAQTNAKWRLRVEMIPAGTKGSDWEEDEGTIYAAVSSQPLHDVLRRGRPIVNCRSHHEALQIPTVRVNEFAIGEMAAGYLAARGFEHFFYYCGRDTSPAAELRRAGFTRKILQLGHTLIRPEGLPAARSSAPDALEAIASVTKPLAMFVSHDSLAREMTEHLDAAGIAVPERVAVLGVDDDELHATISHPPLSSVQIPYPDIGYRAAQKLDELLKGHPVAPEPELLEPIGIITRQSTNVFAVDEPQLIHALSFIRAHACDPCSVDDVLQHVAVSRRWLENQFRRRFSHTPHDAIIATRIDRARELLRDPDQTLKSIAEKSGYGHMQNFMTAFRKATGETPSAYRNRIRPRIGPSRRDKEKD